MQGYPFSGIVCRNVYYVRTLVDVLSSVCQVHTILENIENHRYILYENIDQILLNKFHGPTHCKKGCYMCIQWTRVLYSVVITWTSNLPISQFSPCNEFKSVWSMCVYNTTELRTHVICVYDTNLSKTIKGRFYIL